MKLALLLLLLGQLLALSASFVLSPSPVSARSLAASPRVRAAQMIAKTEEEFEREVPKTEVLGQQALVDMVAMNTGFTKKDVSVVVSELIETIKQQVFTLEKEIRIRGLGTFKVTHRASRTNNLGKGPDVIPARKILAFKAAKGVKGFEDEDRQ